MRILQLNCHYEKLGGAEVYFHSLCTGLRQRGHGVGVFAGSEREDVDQPELRIVRRPAFDADRLVREPALVHALTGFARSFRPDLVHAHNLHAFPAELPLALAGLGVPLVQTVHDFNLLCPNSWCVWPDGTPCSGGPGEKCFQHGCEANYPYDARVVAGTWLRHEAAKHAFDRFLAPSEYLAERLRANGFEDVECLPYMVDAAALGAPAGDRPAEESAQRDPRRLLFAGRLVPEKGVRYLIEAMAAVKERVPDARLSIVGEGPEREALAARVAALGLAGVVTFEGHVPHAEMRRFFRTAAAQVLPSIWSENSPVACYESYAFSLPMVASRIGGIPALVVEGETGLLAAARDPADLARRLVELLEDAALRARLAQGCRAALARYSPAEHLTRIEDVYAACLARGARDVPARGARAEIGPLDPDLLAVLDALVRQVGAVERWGLSLEAHARGLAAPEPTGEPAGEPLQRIGRHLVRILQKKLR